MASTAKDRWFIAVLVLESGIAGEARSAPGEGYEPSVDFQFRLIRATDLESAYERALVIGKKAEHGYENPYGETCTWSFKGLKDLQEVMDGEIGDGVEVYGFITDGKAEDHVVSRERLTGFLGMGPDEWNA
jgi:hypothetical protein